MPLGHDETEFLAHSVTDSLSNYSVSSTPKKNYPANPGSSERCKPWVNGQLLHLLARTLGKHLTSLHLSLFIQEG